MVRLPDPRPKLAIVVSHPIQYYAPWFAYLTERLATRVSVFYLWDFGVTPRTDPGFGHEVNWDIDLLAGYEHDFLLNRASDPGTHHFFGLRNPTLTNALAAWRPDVILLFGYRYWSHLQVILSSRLRKVPLIFRGDSHLLAESGGPLHRLGRQVLLRAIFRRFSAFLPVGAANRDYFRRHGVPEGKLFWAPHSVDHLRFRPASTIESGESVKWRLQLGIPENHLVILFAGKFESKKRPQDLLQAFLDSNLQETTLLFVGAGQLESELRLLAQGHSCIRFAPFQNQSNMPRVYAAADLVVLPSRGSGESWGMVINEAMACGKAVIVSDEVGCHPDLVRPDRNGLVFRAGDLDALAGSLREACSDKERLKSWGDESERIIAAFSFAETTAGLDKALARVLKSRVPA